MLIGSYSAVLSDSRRVAVPKKFNEELGSKPIVAKWYEDCLIIVSNGFWENLSKRLTGDRKTIDLGVRDIERFILGSAFETEPDEQGSADTFFAPDIARPLKKKIALYK